MALARCTVPIFFMITGFFYSRTAAKEKRYAQIKHVLLLNIFANIFYFIFFLIRAAIAEVSVGDTIMNLIYSGEILRAFFLNVTHTSVHLWYLSALLYVLILVLVIDKYLSPKIINRLIPFLVFANLALGTYSPLWYNGLFPTELSRNFLFNGLPSFYIGYRLAINQNLTKRKDTKVYLFFIVLFSATSIGESYFTNKMNFPNVIDLYISTIPLSITVFMLALRYTDIKNKYIHKLSFIGKKYSGIIYIIHRAIYISLSGFFKRLPYWERTHKVLSPFLMFSGVYEVLKPFVIFALSLAFSVVFYKMVGSYKNRRLQK